ncbi:MarR family winged helix-turn-helix transcriptional regulator [uncultured Pseudoramibacter sp.]|jgi:DNA-binding MarR family transcriptional regulator|uniref:MarR family winged helix-turn-helix transcriptional regulator n=1 Tax=uncultured Pseudoramibacter sp. TaxID=1623493 RepID=UPI0025E29FDD|nr:MarR family winged helix-turn-helix transcriptional regulator [uncultured Pseudoramibacter sp.]
MDAVDETKGFGPEFIKLVLTLNKGSITQYLREKAELMELRYGEFIAFLQILRADEEGRKTTVSSLSRANHCTKSNMSQIVRVLEEKDYVGRVPSQRDRRTVFLEMTPHARDAILKHRLFLDTPLNEAAKRMGPEKSGQLITLLWELWRTMEQIAEEKEETGHTTNT